MKNPAVRYGRMPKRPREVASSENMQDLAKSLGSASGPGPGGGGGAEEPREADSVTTELARAVAAAHRTSNSYTEELRGTLQPRAILLPELDDEQYEGTHSFFYTSFRVQADLATAVNLCRNFPQERDIVSGQTQVLSLFPPSHNPRRRQFR